MKTRKAEIMQEGIRAGRGPELDQHSEPVTEWEDPTAADARRLMAKAEASGDFRTALSAFKELTAIEKTRTDRLQVGREAAKKVDLPTTLRKIAEIYGLDPDMVVGPASQAELSRPSDLEMRDPKN
jgi:hypothetical protein